MRPANWPRRWPSSASNWTSTNGEWIMTEVDILMPYYGDESLMRTAVRSVLVQDDPRWRLTVVDDGTVPGVAEWFASLGHSRVRYLRNEHNLGVTGNFNKCLDLAEHELTVLMG